MLVKYQNAYPKFGGVYVGYPGNPLPEIPPWSIRFRYSTSSTPTLSKGTLTLVDEDEHIWDLTYENEDWTSVLAGPSPSREKIVEIMGSNSSGVTNIDGAFSQLRIKKVSQFDTSNVTSMRGTFYNSTHIEEIPLLDTSKVKDMYWAFWACKSLKEMPAINTSNVSEMEGAFRYCESMSSFPVLDTSNVSSMESTFADCSGLKYIPSLDTSNLRNTYGMFYNCVNVESGISSFYNQLLNSPVSYHTLTFRNCGINTQQGQAELALIPSGWK